MKKKYLSFGLFLALLSLTLACRKNADVVVAATPPTLTLNSPNDNDQLLGGQVLTVKGQVADANGLKTLTVKIIADVSGSILFETTPSVLDKKSYDLNTSWTVKVNDWLDATMTITVENSAGLKTEKKVKMKLWL